MPDSSGANRPARTVLEQLIRDRRQTLEEFAAYAETFAREHNEPGTLSVRHLQRLIAGRRSDGRPLGPVRPATARLLERVFNVGIDELLAAPDAGGQYDSASELQNRLQASARVDSTIIAVLYEQLHAIRRLDRQLGVNVAYEEVQVKVAQVEKLLTYAVSGNVRARLAALHSELCMLAGWQALDLRNPVESWRYYERAKAAARESHSKAFEAHAAVQQAFVLIDIGHATEAVAMIADVRENGADSSPALLRSWLAAAHGEALAANNEQSASLQAFDDAEDLLTSSDVATDVGPYVVLDSVHLGRWRGHALARFGGAVAVSVLSSALDRLDPTFVRAATALRIDLAAAFVSIGELAEARIQLGHARHLAAAIGSMRQERRIARMVSVQYSGG